MNETTTETKELALFPKLNLPTVTGITEQMNKSFGTMYTRIEAGIAALPTDMSIKKNREEVASYAYDIARTKTGLDKAAADVSGEAKQIVDAVNAERRQLKDTLDTLKAKARAALDAWEAQQAQQQQATTDAIARHDAECIAANGKPSQWIADTIGEIEHELYCEAAFGAENVERLEESKAATLDLLRGMLADAEKREAEQAELEQLRREKAEREEADRKRREEEEAAEAARIAEEKRKADEAAEAARQEEERARIAREAEEKAAALRLRNYKITTDTFANQMKNAGTFASGYIADFIQHDEDMSFTDDAFPADKIGELEAARAETVAKLKQMEIERKAEEQAEVERLVADRKAEEKRREEETAARAEEEAKRREEEAARKERERIQQEKDEEERQRLTKEKADQERAADLAHRKKVNSAAVEAIMKAAGVAEKDAQAIVVAIYKEQVPNVSISY